MLKQIKLIFRKHDESTFFASFKHRCKVHVAEIPPIYSTVIFSALDLCGWCAMCILERLCEGYCVRSEAPKLLNIISDHKSVPLPFRNLLLL